MESTPKPVVVGGGLSPSSLTNYLSCPRRYFHQKIAKDAPDPDADLDPTAFKVGHAFHKVLEDCKHELSGVKLSTIKETCKSFELEGDEAVMVAAMLAKYKIIHEKAGLKALACEVEIETPAFHGFVDVVLGGTVGWWIADMKTAASFSPALIPTLPTNLQLNLYAAHAAVVADLGGLDLKAFRGCRYRLTTKSRIIRKDGESDASYFTRVKAAVKSFDFVIPADLLRPEKTIDIHTDALNYIRKKKKATQYPQNFGDCTKWNKACQFYSKCHGFNFTSPPQLEVIEAL